MGRRERKHAPFRPPQEQPIRALEQPVPEGMKQCSKCGAIYKRKRKVSGSCPVCQGTGVRNDGKPSLRDQRSAPEEPEDQDFSGFGVDDRY